MRMNKDDFLHSDSSDSASEEECQQDQLENAARWGIQSPGHMTPSTQVSIRMLFIMLSSFNQYLVSATARQSMKRMSYWEGKTYNP